MKNRASTGFIKPTVSYHHTPSLLAKRMFYYIQSVGHGYCSEGYYTDRKGYNSMLILYTISGEGILTYNNKDFPLHPGKLFIIDCMEKQYYAAQGSEIWEFLWVHFNGSESRNYVKYILKNNEPAFSVDFDSEVVKLMNDIFYSFHYKENQFEIINSKRIVQILTELLLIAGREYITAPNINTVVTKTIKIIEKHYASPMHLDTVSKEVNMSKYHLSRIFKKYTGFSFHEYLTAYRINEAKQLLKNSDMLICDIARQVGFDSVSHFIQTFRKLENVTPLKFREYLP